MQGPVRGYWKTHTTPADDVDVSSVVGFTEMAPIVPGSLEFEEIEDSILKEVEALMAPVDEVVTGRKITIKGTCRPATMAQAAVLRGLLTTDVTDSSGTDPKYYQKSWGVWDPENWMNVIFKQQIGTDLYRYRYVIKGRFRKVGAEKWSRLEPGEIPFEIVGVCLETGTHAGKLYIQRDQYAVTTPTITTILPASKAVGELVAIAGTGFGASHGASSITFYNGKVCAVGDILGWTDNLLTVKIPTGAVTGNVKVTVAGVDSNAVSYTVTS